jgi:uncharacterized protein YndB with AHSA1/START domain
MNEVPELEETIWIAAPVAAVWAMISDVTRMPEWSPQVRSVRLRSGFDQVGLGAEFTNRNAMGEGLEWTTHATVVTFEPESEIAFTITENWVTWRFLLTAEGDGTRVTQRREAPRGISDLSQELTDGFMGGTDHFTAVMRTGMAETLARMKAAAESGG